MKLASIVSITTLLAFVPFVRAQDAAPPGPAPELKRFERLIGNYTGKGTLTEPGKPATQWTCQATYAWTLGNHFVAVDTAVDFAGAMPPLAFRELLGWDKESKRYVAISVGNTGEGSLGEITFPTDDTMVQVIAKKTDGKPGAERHETTIAKDGMKFTMTILGCSGAPFECVSGSFTRVDKLKPLAVEAAAAMAPLAAPLAKMNKTAGTYSCAGELIMMPGTPAMKITGTDVCRPIFGGAVMQTSTTGKGEGMPGEYAAENFTVWNADKQCFDSFGADNMGWVGAMEMRFLDDTKIVATCSICYMGQPCVQRTVTDLDAAGRITKVTGTALTGTSEPYCSFKADYKASK